MNNRIMRTLYLMLRVKYIYNAKCSETLEVNSVRPLKIYYYRGCHTYSM